MTADLPSQSELRRKVNLLARLVEVSLTLNSTLDPDRLLLYIIDTAGQLLDCEAVSVLLFDENDGKLRFAASTGSDPARLAQIPVPLDRSIAGTIFSENRPLIIHDVASDARHYATVGKQLHFEIRSLAGVPMRIRERVTGVLEALNKRSDQFDEEDLHILSIIASQAAVAIHNARLVQELQHAYTEISRIDQIKSNFLALASHELRTPLGIILGYAAFLKDEAQGELSEHASAVLSSAQQMRGVLEAMSNMTLMRTGALDLQIQPTPVQPVVQAAYSEVLPMAHARSQEISLFLPEEPVTVQADPAKLQLAFINMLNNAVRFSPTGGHIVIGAVEGPGKITIGIQDNGIGIPPTELERIFEEFYQVEHHLTRHYGGLGLGLTIARGLVEMQGGRIWAESAGLGQGACFKVELPT
ncbi:MAG TPA: ATP-binding protein [Anaerolineaceae bacterium]|nr:ATP-binding protein [Anaerolineaceae bacterium]